MKPNILVTGGAGYIGSHVCKTLYQCGYTPITYDNLENGHKWAVQWGPLVKGDIADKIKLNHVFLKYKPYAVIHLAAFALVGESVKDPKKYYQNNVAGSLVLLETMLEHNVKKIIFSSTCATYGLPMQMLINEKHQQNPINPYGNSKLMVEIILCDFCKAYDFKSISLRYFNAAGADPDGQIGEAHNPETHLIPLALKAATGDIPEITIFGDDYDTNDGTCIRDYIHVNDLADAHVLSLKFLDKSKGFSAFNLGNERGFSVREVFDEIERVTGRQVPFKIGPRRVGDPTHLVGDATLAKICLGWSLKRGDLNDIINTSWKWHLNQKKKEFPHS
jgi:UDP-arabinose 4-epimerase